MWSVYILECDDGFLYTGITQQLEKRFKEHQSGIGAKFTGYRRPRKIVYYEAVQSEAGAKLRELQIKRWSRAKKQALIEGKLQELSKLSVSRD